MLYELFSWLDTAFDFPGAGAFEYISTRTGLAAVTSVIISLIIGRRIIKWLSSMQLKEVIREDIGLDHHQAKAGTPSMGGVIILLAVIIPSILFMKMDSVYAWLIVFVIIALGLVGFVDDYIKVVKKDKSGLAGRFKIVGQVGVGIVVGAVLYFHPDFADVNTLSTVPFLKNVNIDYAFFGEDLGWMIFIPVAVFVITAVSNATNLTDGLDGLASGVSAICGFVFAIFAYVSGRTDLSGYLDIMYLPGAGELTIFCAALIGGCMGFLWYNTNPASVFMGDTGSLALGGAFGALGLMLHKELLLPFICGVFFFETLSVIIQTTYFKYTKKKYGVGKRVFLMTPIHHHFEKKGWSEQKIVVRFWIITVMLGILSLLTLKIR
ncbi:MAG TPA: phospho-N-acetylmuramoyl-pentapeptide-transferase [Balneola sp.]|mgnify:FL=1|jgi:phospho-N-acetylmuramoyl-pentapeptide-transferase|nr:phospho-N-acetylmuramoyl-pentapeptide-transferase [Balneola sp.]MAO78700.1 phospho-N-acetylmuramoyl-pentapeptide-transferase [Balneola sp.]MBF64785.1 phospho-N-acetylmuramoyl-pentapeptide-transferase [Balneola sp.]HAH50252.1 phospho-N-acetylmuramoyl-pentapeptide-transferase [Balneola sp.]HCI69596.1 phospho-N-acetylmuramoyl-pentapeptide-transferase [Balneola sp.]|tara:strand:- start:1152 stop:2288 length:1137 start_codon:yes stop_codon:yes gene_type:complete